jgi:hypothetical protein
MEISFDPAKRDWTLHERGLDFLDAIKVFDGPNYRFIDERFDYGEERIVTIGYLLGRMVVIVWTDRPPARHIISMRRANDREKASYGKFLD